MKTIKTVSFILALSVFFSIVPFVFAEDKNVAENDATEYQIDISEYFNADFIAYEGDELDSKTWMGGEEFSKNIIERTGYPKADYYTVDTGKYLAGTLRTYYPVSSSFHGFPSKFDTDEAMTAAVYERYGINYSFDTDSFFGGVKDAFLLDVSDTSFTLETSKRLSRKLSFCYIQSDGARNIPITLSYTDGSYDEKILTFTNNNNNGVIATEYYAIERNDDVNDLNYGKAQYVKTFVRGSEKDAVETLTASTKVWDSAATDIKSVSVELDDEKTLERITLDYSEDSNVFIAILAVTEDIVSNAELKADADALNESSSAEEAKKAKTAIEELIKRGIYEEEYTGKLALANRLINADNPLIIYTDLSKNKAFTADMVGFEGDIVGENWLGGISKSSIFSGLNASYIFPDTDKESLFESDAVITSDSIEDYTGYKIIYDEMGNISGYEKNDGTQLGLSEAPPCVMSDKQITIKLNNKGLKGGVSDAVDLGDGATVELSGRPLSELWFAFCASTRINKYNLEVEYTDGTTGVLTVCPVTMHLLKNDLTNAEERLYNEKMAAFQFNRYGGLEPNHENMLIINDFGIEGTSKAERIGYTMIGKKIENKGIKTIKFPKKDELLLAGITEIPADSYEMEKFVKVVSENTTAETLRENLTALSLAKTYVDELIKRGFYGEDSEEVVKINGFLNEFLMVENSFSKVDENTVKLTFGFNKTVSESDFRTYIKIKKNNEEVSAYNISFSENTAYVELEDSMSGGNSYNVIVSEMMPLIMRGYEFSYTSPSFIEVSFNNGELIVTNNTEKTYKFSAAVTETKSDGSFKYHSYIKNAELIDEFSASKVLTDGYNAEVIIWDENMKPYLEVTPIEICKSETVLSADYNYPQLDFQTNILKISGKTPNEGKNKIITLDVLKEKDSIIKKQIKTNADGYFEFEISLSQLSESAELSFKLGGDDFGVPVSLEKIYFSSENDRTDAIVDIMGAVDETATALIIKGSDFKNKLALDFQVVNALDLDKAAKIITANKNKLSATDLPGSRDLIRRLFVVEAFNQGKKDIVSKDGVLLYEALMGYKSINSDNVTLYNVYNDFVSLSGKQKIIEILTDAQQRKELLKNHISRASSEKNEFENSDELLAVLKELILVYALKNPLPGGSGYVSDVLTKANTDAVGLDISKYHNILDKSEINSVISEASVNSLSDIKRVVDNFTPVVSMGGGVSSGSVSGGSFSSSSGYVGKTGDVVIPTVTPEPQNIFKDVSTDHWAYESIKYLYDNSIVSGKGDGNFKPDDKITRAELVKIICESKGLKTKKTELPFVDVTSDSWYAPYVAAAYENNLINGISETKFAPEESVTRQDICVILYRISKKNVKTQATFFDFEDISDYAKDAVNCFSELKIINGFEDNTFKPLEGCTRAQCAKIIYSFLKQ